MENKEDNLYEFISDMSNEAFIYTNYTTGYVVASSSWRKLFNVSKGCENHEDKFLCNIFEQDRVGFIDKMERILARQEENYKIEYRLNDGKTWISHSGTNKFSKSGELLEKFAFFRDITTEKNKTSELEYMAYFDAETGVYNRNYFLKRLDNAISKAQEGGYNRVQVMYIDIDNFNVTKNSIGLTMGDELLVKFAAKILKYSNHSTKVGRFSNDEFAIALYDAIDDNEVVKIYQAIIKDLERPIVLSDDSEIYVTLSVGIAIYPTGGMSASELVKCADIAMYYVKKHGKASMCIFEEGILQSFIKKTKMEQKLKSAVENLDFVLYYQPQYFSGKNKLRGFEALIRWRMKDGTLINPGDFIPMAEKNGCIVDIGKWVINQALSDFKIWNNTYHYNGIISINISAVQLMDKNFAGMLLESIMDKGLSTTDIEIEITESMLIENFQQTVTILRELKNNGVKISLDDFGTGYSSLSYLKDIPISTLKIDKSFVDSMLEDSSTEIITDSVIKMVKKLGLETIAEGVETEEQYEYLKKMDCDNIQGFLLGRPMSVKDVTNLLKHIDIT